MNISWLVISSHFTKYVTFQNGCVVIDELEIIPRSKTYNSYVISLVIFYENCVPRQALGMFYRGWSEGRRGSVMRTCNARKELLGWMKKLENRVRRREETEIMEPGVKDRLIMKMADRRRRMQRRTDELMIF